MSEIPNQNEILHYLELNEAACGFEAQTYAIRGYGAFDRTTTQIPDPIYIKVAAWLRELTETPSSLAQAAAEVERLKDILFRLYNVCGIMVFRPDQGQPHPMPDGVYDRTMAEANDALRDYTPSSAALSAPAPDEVVVLPTIEQSSIVALNQAIAKICDLEELAIERSDDDHDDGDDPNSYGEGYDSGYIFGLRDAKGAVEELAAAQAALVERAKGQ